MRRVGEPRCRAGEDVHGAPAPETLSLSLGYAQMKHGVELHHFG